MDYQIIKNHRQWINNPIGTYI